jgi:RNA polymerase sigma-70 factor (ECF subfamily)
MDEARLIQLAQRGDVSAFNELVLFHQAQMFNVAYRVMGDSAAAADATQ